MELNTWISYCQRKDTWVSPFPSFRSCLTQNTIKTNKQTWIMPKRSSKSSKARSTYSKYARRSGIRQVWIIINDSTKVHSCQSASYINFDIKELQLKAYVAICQSIIYQGWNIYKLSQNMWIRF